jgi:hypothetical protein
MLLCEFVTDNREEIIRRCRSKTAKRVEVSPAAPPHAASEHGVPQFLDELVDELRLKPSENRQIKKTATKHGRDLLHQGFTVSQVVHGYGDVCQAITEMAVENQTSISSNDFGMLNRALDHAIAAAVTQYGSERDTSLHAEANPETEHGAALAGPQGPKGSTSPDVDAAIARLNRIQTLADELAKCPLDVLDQLDVSTRIYNEIQAAKRALKREP